MTITVESTRWVKFMEIFFVSKIYGDYDMPTSTPGHGQNNIREYLISIILRTKKQLILTLLIRLYVGELGLHCTTSGTWSVYHMKNELEGLICWRQWLISYSNNKEFCWQKKKGSWFQVVLLQLISFSMLQTIKNNGSDRAYIGKLYHIV